VGAVPVGPLETIDRARVAVDELAVLTTPDEFWSVGGQYAEFAQVSDEEVVEYLKSAERALAERALDEKHRGVSHHYGSSSTG
jgi:putative phosphoribosyl transferase